jgi:hypothetical protein
MSEQKQQVIRINRENNEKYFSLIDEFNSIVKESASIALGVMKFSMPKAFLFGYKKKILTLGEQVKESQEKFLEWDAKASNFMVHPEFNIPSIANGDVSFFHYMDVLRDIRMAANTQRDTMIRNYNGIYSEYSDRINFMIAIASFLLSFAGVAYSIILSLM